VLEDEELSDITLEASRHQMGLVMVRANRTMLAAQSLVFRRMIYAEYAKAQQSSVDHWVKW
jgi:hypothetical protein